MAAIALLLSLLAIAATYFGVMAIGARARLRAIFCFVFGFVLFIAAIAVTISGHALNL